MTVASSRRRRTASQTSFLDGQLLIAMPAMKSRIFTRSVIYMCMHNEQGAMGLIINQRAGSISFPKLLQELGVLDEDEEDELAVDVVSMPVQIGGPVETGRGFVLHSEDYSGGKSTMAIDGGICLTNTVDILRAIAHGRGPERALLALGYAGWAPGQLEDEIQANGWLSCAADAELLFDPNLEYKYDRALSKLGVDPSHLVSYTGHA